MSASVLARPTYRMWSRLSKGGVAAASSSSVASLSNSSNVKELLDQARRTLRPLAVELMLQPGDPQLLLSNQRSSP